jgi:hypothetical protein
MKKLLILCLLILAANGVLAQRNYLLATWNYNVPLSNSDFLNSSSGAGGKIGYRFQIAESRFSVGLDINWATYDEYKPYETFEQPGGATSTDYINYIYNYGAVVSGQYSFPLGEKELFIPYGGIGIGANYNVYRTYYNVFQNEDKRPGFLVRPEAGMLIRFGERKSLGAIVGISYDYSTNKSEDFGNENFSSFGAQVGLVLMSR